MHTPPTQSIPNIRLRNVMALYKQFVEHRVALGEPPMGLERAYAQHIVISPSLWSQIKGGRSIGDALARQIENKSEKSPGWLDELHPDTAPDPAEEKFIAMCRDAWRGGNRKTRTELTRSVAAALGL
jgi:hypothetical protein